MIDNTNWIFKNCPFQMLDVCFKKLFPGVNYEAHFHPDLKDDNGEDVYGLTNFTNDGKIEILIGVQLPINDTVETFAHELAHAGVGADHEHDDVWAKAFDDLFDEYNKLGEEIWGSNVDLPSGADYQKALAEQENADERQTNA